MPIPKPRGAARPPAGGLPFASYAQIVRMLVPSAEKICFYDAASQALWVSDGVEEAELAMHVQLVLARASARRESPFQREEIATAHDSAVQVLAIRGPNRDVLGAITLTLRSLPANTSYRRGGTIEGLLAPVVEVLAHGWRAAAARASRGQAQRHEVQTAEADTSLEPVESPAAPAQLRRSLSVATSALQCAFGALVVPRRPFTLTHRLSAEESDVAVAAAVDTLRAPMQRLAELRKEPFAVNAGPPMPHPSVDYKYLVCPLRAADGRLASVLMLFRQKTAPDFQPNDVAALAPIVAQISSTVLESLIPAAAAPSEAKPTAQNGGEKRIPEPARKSAEAAKPAADVPMPLDQRLRAVLRAGAFDLYAQPIASLRSQPCRGRFEVLVRMRDADTLCMPRTFFGVAEASGLLPDLDRCVIRQALQALGGKRALLEERGWEFCINLSGQSLLVDRFGEFLEAQVTRSAVAPKSLVFEIAESSALEHRYAAERLAARLRDLGCGLALDNCRSGLDTFGPIRRWPVSCLKIDASITQKIAADTRSAHLVREVAEVASDIGIETVGEQVERENIRSKLTELHVDFGQGFLFSRPRPLADVLR
jgi:EAL domain-containing protein (putative c-di-GMP-specific phosphodiesterase class I)